MQPRGREGTSRGGSRTAPTSWFRVFVFIATAAGCSHSASQADLHSIPHQNVLLITIDTLRADALGCYGGPAATALGFSTNLGEGSTDSNLPMSLKIPAITIGGGGRGRDAHALTESFDTTDAWMGTQHAMLVTIALAQK